MEITTGKASFSLTSSDQNKEETHLRHQYTGGVGLDKTHEVQ